MKYNIVLPESYESSSERYPVLYLLHGLTSNYVAWSRMGTSFYAGVVRDLIIVMPDGGNSWYVNWAANDEGRRNAWEDHIIQDVIGHVDENFRTIARREGRAINGLSMGGYGGPHARTPQSRAFRVHREHQWRTGLCPHDRGSYEG